MKKSTFAKLFVCFLLSAFFFAGELSAKTMKQAKFDTNLHCASCKGKIEKALKAEKGVVRTNADVATKAVTVDYDADITTDVKIKKVVTDLGYTVDGGKADTHKSCTDKEDNCKDKTKCSGSCKDKTK